MASPIYFDMRKKGKIKMIQKTSFLKVLFVVVLIALYFRCPSSSDQLMRLGELMTNERPVSGSCDHFQPMRGQYPGHRTRRVLGELMTVICPLCPGQHRLHSHYKTPTLILNIFHFFSVANIVF